MDSVPYTLPANFKKEDEGIFYFRGWTEPTVKPQIKMIENCYWHMGARKDIRKTNWGWLKIILAKVGFRYRLQKKLAAAAWISDTGSVNFFHWINDALPKIFFLKDHGVEVVTMVHKKLSRINFIKESFELMNLPVVYYDAKDITPIGKLYTPGYTAAGGAQHPIYFKKMATTLKFFNNKNSCRKIFISRTNNTIRQLKPKESVDQMLLKLGIEIIISDSMSLEKQIKLFSECSHLIAVHGAGLVHMCFMPPSAKIFEIRREDDKLNYCYYKMAHALNIEYHYFLASSADNIPNLQEDNYLVNVETLEKELKKFIA